MSIITTITSILSIFKNSNTNIKQQKERKKYITYKKDYIYKVYRYHRGWIEEVTGTKKEILAKTNISITSFYYLRRGKRVKNYEMELTDTERFKQ